MGFDNIPASKLRRSTETIISAVLPIQAVAIVNFVFEVELFLFYPRLVKPRKVFNIVVEPELLPAGNFRFLFRSGFTEILLVETIFHPYRAELFLYLCAVLFKPPLELVHAFEVALVQLLKLGFFVLYPVVFPVPIRNEHIAYKTLGFGFSHNNPVNLDFALGVAHIGVFGGRPARVGKYPANVCRHIIRNLARVRISQYPLVEKFPRLRLVSKYLNRLQLLAVLDDFELARLQRHKLQLQTAVSRQRMSRILTRHRP